MSLCETEKRKKRTRKRIPSEGNDTETAAEFKQRVLCCAVGEMGHILKLARGFFRNVKKRKSMTKEDLEIVWALVLRLNAKGMEPYQIDILRFIFYLFSGSLAGAEEPLVKDGSMVMGLGDLLSTVSVLRSRQMTLWVARILERGMAKVPDELLLTLLGQFQSLRLREEARKILRGLLLKRFGGSMEAARWQGLFLTLK